MAISRSKRRSPAPDAVASPPRRSGNLGKVVFANREQSWLAFNRRVLEQARSASNPLLERVKFLAIVSSNLDEFYEIRVAGLMQQADSESSGLSIDGLTPREQLRRVHKSVHELVADQYACWHRELVPQLDKVGIQFRTAGQLDDADLAWVKNHFETQVL